MERVKQPLEEPRTSAVKRWLNLSAVLPIVALCLSIASFYLSEKAALDVAHLEAIKTEYGLYHDLAQLQLQNPLMAHLFTATNQAYDALAVNIKAATTALTEPERARTLLEERAMAHYLFTTYEEAYYLWRQTSEAGDKRREELADDNLKYFNSAICSNPRLLWYWDRKGGKLDRAFAVELRDYYEDNVLKGCHTESDAAGPFQTLGRQVK